MEDLEDPQSHRGLKLRIARERTKRRLQFFTAWTVVSICLAVSLNLNPNDDDCGLKSTCSCGTYIRIFLII